MPIPKLPERESRENRIYNRAIEMPLRERAFLLEAGQGRNTNGNVFAILKAIRKNSAFDDAQVSLVLVPEKQEEGRRKISKYGIDDVDIITFGSDEYRTALGTYKYLITDNSFPAYFYKRPGQVYLNTWHGTPLKALGRADIGNAISLANVQANMAKADYLLHPSRYTRDIMLGDYMMERVYGGRVVIMDYPRNDALYAPCFSREIKERLGINGKRAIAYMPTWRGSGRDADVSGQAMQTEKIIREMEKLLDDDEVLLVNLHFLIGSRMDFSRFSKVREFPPEYETYDVLACCDTLITDYSSVAMDFAGTGREIILFMYDYEEYKKEKGFYFDIRTLPFGQAYAIDELGDLLHSESRRYRLDDKFLSADRGRSSERILSLICGCGETGFEIEDFNMGSKAPAIAFFENINRPESREKLRELQAEYSGRREDAPVLMFVSAMKPETIDTLRTIGTDLDYVRISGHLYCSNDELLLLWAYKKTGLFGKAADRIYKREAYRQMGQFRSSGLQVMQGKKADRLHMIERLARNNREHS